MTVSAGLVNANNLTVTGTQAGAVTATNVTATNLTATTVNATNLDFTNLGVLGDLNVAGMISTGTDVPPNGGPQGDGLINASSLYINSFNENENPYYTKNNPLSFISYLTPNQTYRNSTSRSIENDIIYFNPNAVSDLSGGVFAPSSTETWNIPLYIITPLTYERPDVNYVRNNLWVPSSYEYPMDSSFNLSGTNLNGQQIYYSPDSSGIIINATQNSDIAKITARLGNKVLRATTNGIQYIPDVRSNAQVARAKEVGSLEFIDSDVRELIADTGLNYIVLDGVTTTPITTDPTDMYRIYVTQDTSNNWPVWPNEQSELPDWQSYLLQAYLPNYVQPTTSLLDPAVQTKLNDDYNNSAKELVYTNGIASVETRLQFRSYVPTVMNGVLSGNSIGSLNVVDTGKGFTSIPTLGADYYRYWYFAEEAPYPSLSGFDDPVFYCKTLGATAEFPYGTWAQPLDPSGVVIQYSGSGIIPDASGLVDVEFLDSGYNGYNSYFANPPIGKARIVGGQVVEVIVTEVSFYSYPPVYGRIVNGRNKAVIETTLNADTTLSFNLTSGGSGYTTEPIFSTSGGTEMTFARASAVVSGGHISGITVTTPGAGYIDAEYTTVEIVDLSGSGAGATAHAVVSNGSIASIVVDASGMNYSDNVQVNINGGRPWLYNSVNIDYFRTNAGSIYTQLIKNPNGQTAIMFNSISDGRWDRKPVLPNGAFDLSANYLDATILDNSVGWSWLPKIYQYKAEFPNNSLADYERDKNTYTPVRNAGDPFIPYIGSFDTTRWSLDLCGANITNVDYSFVNGRFLLSWDSSNNYHYDNALNYLNETFYNIGDNYGGGDNFRQLFIGVKDLLDDSNNSVSQCKYRGTNAQFLASHEFGHTAGLNHTQSNDLCFSTGFGAVGDFSFTQLVANPFAPSYLQPILGDSFFIKREDGSRAPGVQYNVMGYTFEVCTFTKEQRLVMRTFLSTDRPSFIHSITNDGVYTGYLDFYYGNDASGCEPQTIIDLNNNKLRSNYVISDKVQSRILESDTIDVNGMVRSQISKSELGVFDQIVIGNDEKRIYIDSTGNLVIGNIRFVNENGQISLQAM